MINYRTSLFYASLLLIFSSCIKEPCNNKEDNFYLPCDIDYEYSPVVDTCTNYPPFGSFFQKEEGDQYFRFVSFPDQLSKILVNKRTVINGQSPVDLYEYLYLDLCDRSNVGTDNFPGANDLLRVGSPYRILWLNNNEIIGRYGNHLKKFNFTTGEYTEVIEFDHLLNFDVDKQNKKIYTYSKLTGSLKTYIHNYEGVLLDSIVLPEDHTFYDYRVIGNGLLGLYQIGSQMNISYYDFEIKTFDMITGLIDKEEDYDLLDPNLGFISLGGSEFLFRGVEGIYKSNIQNYSKEMVHEFGCDKGFHISEYQHHPYMGHYLFVSIVKSRYLEKNPEINDTRLARHTLGIYNMETQELFELNDLP